MLKGVDWHEKWKNSQQYAKAKGELNLLKDECASRPPTVTPDGLEYASTLGQQLKIVIRRHVVALWRKPVSIITTQPGFSGLTFVIGLHLEQNPATCGVCPVCWIHVLEGRERNLRSSVAPFRHLQLRLRLGRSDQSTAASLLGKPKYLRSARKEIEDVRLEGFRYRSTGRRNPVACHLWHFVFCLLLLHRRLSD